MRAWAWGAVSRIQSRALANMIYGHDTEIKESGFEDCFEKFRYSFRAVAYAGFAILPKPYKA